MLNIPVLIGSQAAHCSKSDSDWDFMGTNKALWSLFKNVSDQNGGTKASYPTSESHLVHKTGELILEGDIAYLDTTTYETVQWVQDHYNVGAMILGTECYVAPHKILWLLKESHKYKDSVHFEKTRNDVLNFRSQAKGLSFEEVHKNTDKDLVDILYRREIETYRKPISLNVQKDEFFSNDGVKYIYDHDYLHECLKTYHLPAYTFIQKEGSEVACSKELWDSVGCNIKDACVIEEAMVIALERGILPFGYKTVSRELALNVFKKALQKICTSLCSGYFREYAWIHYDLFVDRVSKYYSQTDENNFCQNFLNKHV